jgi:hypothetical protein
MSAHLVRVLLRMLGYQVCGVCFDVCECRLRREQKR